MTKSGLLKKSGTITQADSLFGVALAIGNVQEIVYNTMEFQDILNNPDFNKYFGEMEGEKLKTTPTDYSADHPAIELLKHKSFLATHYCTDEQVLSDGFLKHCASAFRALRPFDAFLNRSTD